MVSCHDSTAKLDKAYFSKEPIIYITYSQAAFPRKISHANCTPNLTTSIGILTMTTTKSSQGGRKLLPTITTCAYCAVLLTGHSVGAAATTASSSKSASARSLSENKAYLGQYKFDTKTGFGMPDAANIDQDMKLIVSNLETNDDAGFAKAHEVYMNGRNFDGDYFLELDISDLSEDADVDLKDSSTYKTYNEYYGVSNYADVWAQASFEGKLASGLENGKFDFTKLGREGRAGE